MSGVFIEQVPQLQNANNNEEADVNLEASLRSSMETSNAEELESLGAAFLSALGEQEETYKKKTAQIAKAWENPSDPTSLLQIQMGVGSMQSKTEFLTMLASKGVNMIDSLTKMG